MKKSILLWISALGLSCIATSCAEDGPAGASGQGYLSLNLEVDNDIVSARSAAASRASDPSGITHYDLSLCLSNDSRKHTWDRFEDFKSEDETFSPGSYLLEAYYGDKNTEGFEKPYFYGSTQIEIADQKTTTVQLTAEAGKALLYIVPTDKFIEYMEDYDVTVTTEAGNTIIFYPDETRPTYVQPGKVNVTANVTKPNGTHLAVGIGSYTLEARHAYTLSIDLVGDTDSAVISVDFDDTIEPNDVEVDISDSLELTAAPVAVPSGFESGATVNTIQGVPFTADRLIVDFIAEAGISQVTMTVNQADNGKQTFDLIGLDEETLESLKGYGFKFAGIEKPARIAEIDVTDVIPNLGDKTTLTFVATDKNGLKRSTETITLVIDVKPLIFKMTKNDPYFIEGNPLTINLNYNGGDIENQLVFWYKNCFGQDTQLNITDIKETKTDNYAVTFEQIGFDNTEADNQIQIWATLNDNEQDSKLTLYGSDFRVNPNRALDIYAYQAYLTPAARTSNVSLPSMDGAEIRMRKATDNNYETVGKIIDGKYFLVENLEPATQYMARIYLGKQRSQTFTFTTKAAQQIPDANMDVWTPNQTGDRQYLWKVGNGTPWDTMNPLTASKRGTAGSQYAYKSTSGTIPANSRSTKSHSSNGADGHTAGQADIHNGEYSYSGANAALIRTVGYGSGNTAWLNNDGKCQNIEAGQLYLGKYASNEPDYGYEFHTRPSALSFWYHYEPVNASYGDFGWVEITVLDEDGNTIAHNEQKLTEPGAWHQISLPLTYGYGCREAGAIDIRFYSSKNPDVQKQEYMRAPASANTSGGEYVGSELYVDEITLEYKTNKK